MADVHDKKTRSYNMSQIRSKDTNPEMEVRKFLHSNGFRYRLHVKDLPGKPDIKLPKYRTAIFIHGCFWHRHNQCDNSQLPGTNREYWELKLKKNVERDKLNIETLRGDKWLVLVIWECELRTEKNVVLLKILKALTKKAVKPIS